MDAWRRQRDLDWAKVHRGPLPDGLQGPHVADDEFTGNADYWRAVDKEHGSMTLLSAIDAINAYCAQADESQQLVAAKCRALITGYDRRWRNAGYVPERVEDTLTSDLYNPDTKGKSRTFQAAGKLDVVAQYLNRRVLIDHKTASQDIADPNAPYWRQLVIEGQVSHYMLLQWMHGEKCDDALWDVIRKPSISPKKITKAEIKAVVSLGEYYDQQVSEADKQTFIDGGERETLAMYEARLVHDCTKERPDWYFARRSVPRMDSEILEYSRELWQHSQDMLYTRQQERLPPRNSGACMLYGSPCKFLGICSGHDTPDSDRWQKKSQIHPELPADIENPKGLLTNSRIRTFQTCRRKHYYEYELAIERQDEEEREALYFGNVIHEGLRAWWEG
jgi:hypothetical protein